MSLQDKACIVTGAGRGIGRAIVGRLTAAGANVLAVARTASDLEESAGCVRANPGNCLTQAADVTDPAQVEAIIATARKEFGRIDVLINNAGAAPLSPLTKTTDEAFDQCAAVNMKAVFLTCRTAWNDLAASRGTIVNISSLASVDPFPGFAVYGASKAWVNLFTKAIAAEGAKAGIKAFAVAPGAVETQMLRQHFPKFPADQTLEPDAVAAMVGLVLDDRCQYATGQTIFVKA